MRAAERLAAAGLPAARREARLLVGVAAGIQPETIVGWPERSLQADAEARLEELVTRRCRGEPASRLIGWREFWSLPFRLSPETLDPRPDSETLVEAALGTIADRQAPLRLLDLGTGTGCLLLSLLFELPAAFGIGVDASEGACRTARSNAVALGLGDRAGFVVADWAAPLGSGYDLVLSNPPYVRDDDIDRLPPEVARYDPRLALSGGPDGLDAYRILIPQISRLLRPGGVAVVEVGAGQADAVRRLFEEGLWVHETHRDLGGIERCVLARAAQKFERP